MPTTILVPIDITTDRDLDQALTQACKIAQPELPNLCLLYVVPDVPEGYVAPDIRSSAFERFRYEAFERLTAIAAIEAEGRSCEIIVREGSPANTILRVAEEIDADLIVMASHNPTYIDYIMGSVAGKVVRFAQCSVLVVRSKQFRATGSAQAPTSFSA
jgi:nucleotide-binding universal stress UspA family protein